MPFPRRVSTAALLLLPGGLLLGTVPTGAEPLYYWVPGTVALESLDRSEVALYYEGNGGRLVGAESDDAASLAEELGGKRLDVRATHDHYVYYLQDGLRAQFDPPAEVLLRAEHEVLLAVPRATSPRLTAASAAALRGFRESVYVSLVPIAWPQATSPPRRTAPPFDPSIAQMIDGVSATTYLSAWQPLQDLGTRWTFAVPENDDAVDWIHDRFAAMGYGAMPGTDLAFHHYSQSGQIRRNVVATLHGSSPEVIYVTGHLDATSGTAELCAPGADDNASGVAAVLEAARVMSLFPGGFARTLKFAAFNGEEQGLRGSQAYVSTMVNEGEEVAGVYNADMIAYRGSDPDPPDAWMFINAASSFLADTFADAVSLYLPGLLEPRVGGALVTASDHASFWNRGYPAILVIESRLFGGELSPWYHTCDDLIANYVDDIDYAVHNTRAIIASAAILAQDYTPGTASPVVEDLARAQLRVPFPSPTTDGATLSFVLPSAQAVTLELYDVRGNLVRTLLRASRERGAQAVHWDGRDEEGGRVAGGVYFARLKLPETATELTRKLTMIR